MPSYGFHSEAADEYLAATRYYLDHASPLVAAAFVAEIEAAIGKLIESPPDLVGSRRAPNPQVYPQSISLLDLLSLGARSATRFDLCSHAFQSAS